MVISTNASLTEGVEQRNFDDYKFAVYTGRAFVKFSGKHPAKFLNGTQW